MAARNGAEENREETSREVLSEKEQEPRGIWRWVFFSALVHGAALSGIFLLPYTSEPRAVSYPVYTVELVGGEKLGGLVAGPPQARVKAAKKPEKAEPSKVAKAEPKPHPSPARQAEPPAKKEPAKIEASRDQMAEPVPAKKVVAEAVKAPEPVKAQEGLPEKVRERLIQAALERVRERAEKAPAVEKAKPGEKESAEVASMPGEGRGAQALGQGGTGGGIVKGLEFIMYRNRMLELIRDRWAWVGKKIDLEVTVKFGVLQSGEIFGLRLVKASGDRSYDDSVVRAVRGASPLPPPPQNYRRDFMDVELTFRPKDLSG
jgi:colicin import membrane protein